MLLWDGACHVHERFSVEKIIELKKTYPDALVLVHPECKGAVAKLADKVGSTAGLLKYAMNSDKRILLLLLKVVFYMKCERNVRRRILFQLLPKITLVLVMNVTLCA